MVDLDAALKRARALDEDEIANAIRTIGFECTQCGACCRGTQGGDDHTATVFPDEVREIQERTGQDWRDVARPMPYGLSKDGSGETFEWALQTDSCGDCTFLESAEDGSTNCGIYTDRPRICRTYPFQVALPGVSEPQGEEVASAGLVKAYECEGLGTPIDDAAARQLARELKERVIYEIEEELRLLDRFASSERTDRTVIHDSEGAKDRDGTPIDVDE